MTYIPGTESDFVLLMILFLSCPFTAGVDEINFGGGGGEAMVLDGGDGIPIDVAETNFFGAGIVDTFLTPISADT